MSLIENLEKFDKEFHQINFSGSSYNEINPAIDFVNDTAYVGVWLPSTTPEKKGEAIVSVEKNLFWLLTSDGRSIPAVEDELEKLKLKLKADTPTISNRWSLESIKSFLDGTKWADFNEVFEKIREILETYIEFPNSEWIDIIAIYIIATYFHQIFNAFGILWVDGTMRAGKSKLGDVIRLLTFNGMKSGSITASALYRMIQSARPTFIIDEAENLGEESEKAREISTVLLNGYKKGSLVYRSREKTFEPISFETYSPKVICNTGGIKLNTIKDRTIRLIMFRAINPKILNSEINENNSEWEEVRSELYNLVMTKWQYVKETSEIISIVGISAREWEIWKPLFTIAKLTPIIDYQKFESFVKEIVKEKESEQETEGLEASVIKVLEKLILEFPIEKSWIPVKEITDYVNDYEGKVPEEKYRYSDKRIGWVLSHLGFKNDKRRVSGGVEYHIKISKLIDIARRLKVVVNEKDLLRINKIREETAQTTLNEIKTTPTE